MKRSKSSGVGAGVGAGAQVRRLLAGAAAAGLILGMSSTGVPARVVLGGGTSTRKADASNNTATCTSAEIAQNNVTTNQQNLPWEIAHAGIGGGATPPDLSAGNGITIAIIDTGIAATDPQLGPVVSGGADFSGSGGDYRSDADGHGTFVASIIAAQPSGADGIIGIAPGARLLIYREAGCAISDGNTEPAMADAINQAVTDGARIINISQDGYDPSPQLQAAVENAYARGVLIVTAAGNYGSSEATDSSTGNATAINPVTYPAYYGANAANPSGTADLLAVGAVDQNSETAGFSETGSYLGVTAPGVAIVGLSNLSANTLVTDDGTSFAAPYVAAVAAILLQHDPSLTPRELMKVLESTASGNGQWSAASGWGEIDPQAALQAVVGDPGLDTLKPLYGAGPNADGPADMAKSAPGQSMKPIVAKVASAAELEQEHGAYYSMGIAGLTVVLALAGSSVLRAAQRRGGRR